MRLVCISHDPETSITATNSPPASHYDLRCWQIPNHPLGTSSVYLTITLNVNRLIPQFSMQIRIISSVSAMPQATLIAIQI